MFGAMRTSISFFGRQVLAVVFLPSLVFFLVPAYAEDIFPGDVKVQTPTYQPASDFDFPMGTYTYEVSWQGIPAAEASVSIQKEPGLYHAIANARTYSGIDIFYRLRYRAESLLTDKDFTPLHVSMDNKENKNERLTLISYLGDGNIVSVREKKGRDPEILRFKPENLTLEPFSAAFLARSLDWAPGITREFDTFNGKARYLITLTCEEQTTIRVNGEIRDVWAVVPDVKNLTDPNANKKLRKATIYVTADKKREILKIVSEVFIGSVTTKLESFTPATEEGNVLQVAEKDRGNTIMR